MTTSAGRLAAACAAIVLITVVVFLPVAGFPFLGLDDPRYVVANAEVQRGLTVESVRWAFTTTSLGFYCPVTCLSHAFDCQLYGLNPRGHHLTSLALHAASAVVLLLAFWRMTGALAPSFAVAALFAVHPVHVEPVAWIAERKELVCGAFWMATLLAYSFYAAKPSSARYAAVLVASLLAMLAKPMAVTIPFALLLLDVWPLGRWPGDVRGVGQPAPVSRLLLEKAPLLAPLVVISLLTVNAQTGLGAVGSAEQFPLKERLANAVDAYGTYVGKAVVPIRLAALYPFEHGSIPLGRLAGGGLVLLAGTAVAMRAFARRRYVTVGWFWFVGTLVPVIGLVHVGSQSMADRYTYVPYVGLFALVAFGAADVLAAAPRLARRAMTVVAVCVVAIFGVMSHAQLSTWKDDESLYRQILHVSPKAILAYFNLGNTYLAVKNDPRGAKELYEKALAIDPNYGDIHLRLGMALNRLGDNEAAAQHYREAARLKPELVEAHVRLGLLDGELGKWDEAVASLERATRLAPGEAQPVALLGFARLRYGDRAGAQLAFHRAVSIDPKLPQAHYYLCLMAHEAGDSETARTELAALREIDPRMAAALEAQLGAARP